MSAPPTVVVVSYRRADLLERCLTSVGSWLPDSPVAVWDNASDGSPAVRALAGTRPDVAWTFSPENVGFARAVNRLAATTSGDFLLLNPDAVLLGPLSLTRDALTRIENMVQMGNMGLPSKAIRIQMVGAIDLIIQVERQRDGGRRVTQVSEVCGMEGDVITMNDIFQLEILGEGTDGRLFGRYKVSRVPPSFARRLAYFGLDRAWKAALDEVEP